LTPLLPRQLPPSAKNIFSFHIFNTHHHKKNQNNVENEWSHVAKQIEDGSMEAFKQLKSKRIVEVVGSNLGWKQLLDTTYVQQTCDAHKEAILLWTESRATRGT